MDNERCRKVTLTRPFVLATDPVTQDAWSMIMGTNPSRFKDREGAGRHPVVGVSWHDAIDYCNGLSRQKGRALAYEVTTPHGDAAAHRYFRNLLYFSYTHIQFGHDGYLYISIGDGGVSSNPQLNPAQDLTSMLGKILRIDVSTVGPATGYSIPPDNPFVGMGGGVFEEVYAYGLRNPWRMTVDRLTGDVWVGDVGQGWMEEVDIITSGSNYGWPWWEGTSCFNSDNGCSPTGFTFPVAEYTHDHGASMRIGKIKQAQGGVLSAGMKTRCYSVNSLNG